MTKAPHYLVAGMGSIGQRHVRNLRALRPDSTISVLRRPTSSNIENCGWDRELVSLADALAASPDAAILAGPASTHVDLALELAKSRIPMLIEKPLSVDMSGLDDLRLICEGTSLPVAVGYNLRFHPILTCVRQRLEGAGLGRVLKVHAEVGQYLPDWRPSSDYRDSVSARRELGGGPLLELSHEFDYLYSLLGMPVAVTCRGGRFSALEVNVEDAVTVILEYESPARLVTVNLDFLQRPANRTCKFICETGTLAVNFVTGLVEEARHADAQTIVSRVELADKNQMYVDELRSFFASCEDGRAPVVTLSDGINVMRIVDAAKVSLRDERTIFPAESVLR